MPRENIEARCRRISPDAYSEKSVCTFVPSVGIVGFIDTSGARDGSRGIAFFGDRMCVNTDGELREIAYEKIGDLHIIDSFEDAFADELSVSAGGAELRISDYSLNKSELKSLLDELRRENAQEENGEADMYADIVAQKLSENAQNRDAQRLESAARERGKTAAVSNQPVIEEYAYEPVIYEDLPPVIVETVVDIPKERSPLPEDYAPTPIPEDAIDWISGTARAPETRSEAAESKPPEKETRPKLPEVMNGFIDRTPVMATAKKAEASSGKAADKEPEPPESVEAESAPMPSESEMREQIENMSPDEMMEFLSETLNEINTEGDAPEAQPGADLQTASGEERPLPVLDEERPPELPPSRWEKLTVEPIWGDIYIKASQSLRQLCESGKLTMEQMEDELRNRLLSAAEAFEQITGDGGRVPKVMIPKITELRRAVDNFDSYFSYGEDIAIRAMFFMLYQMLTYADRIANSPETKSRINDFFRRFGGAMITLSMLDMRV